MKRASLALLLFAFTAASAQNVDEVLKKYYASIGGLEKWKSLNTVVLHSRLVAPQGAPVTVIRKVKRPGKMRIEMTSAGQKVVQTFDGMRGWMLTPLAPEPQQVPDQMIPSLRSDSDIDGLLVGWKEDGGTLKRSKDESINGVDCFVMDLKTRSGEQIRMFIRKETGLTEKIIKSAEQMNPQTGRKETFSVEVLPSEYRSVNGFLFPHKVTTQIQGQVIATMFVDKVETNIPLSDKEFEKPKK